MKKSKTYSINGVEYKIYCDATGDYRVLVTKPNGKEKDYYIGDYEEALEFVINTKNFGAKVRDYEEALEFILSGYEQKEKENLEYLGQAKKIIVFLEWMNTALDGEDFEDLGRKQKKAIFSQFLDSGICYEFDDGENGVSIIASFEKIYITFSSYADEWDEDDMKKRLTTFHIHDADADDMEDDDDEEGYISIDRAIERLKALKKGAEYDY